MSDQTAEWRVQLAGTLLRKLSMHATLSPAECERILSLPVRSQRIPARTVFIEEGASRREACALVQGHACRFKTLADGSRQILSFHIAGDFIDLDSTVLEIADHGVSTLTDSIVAYVPHESVTAAMAEHAGIARAFWRETQVDSSIFREWLLNVGQRDAFTRLAHLLCETALRYSAAGLGRAERFEFPVTQNDLADATAMTAVYVNRTLQRLRAEGWVSMHHGEVRIENWKALCDAAGFDRTYLHIPATIAA